LLGVCILLTNKTADLLLPAVKTTKEYMDSLSADGFTSAASHWFVADPSYEPLLRIYTIRAAAAAALDPKHLVLLRLS
jgi:hypothetical protein